MNSYNNILQVFQQEANNLKQHWRSEVVSGLGVFVVALPVNIAIAVASGFPAVAGLITAIIGGMVAGIFSNATYSIKGPSITMIPIIFLAVHNLSIFYPETGIKYTLATVVLAGIFQILFGLFRLGRRFNMIAEAVVYGSITAIGIMIFAREIHLLVGIEPQGRSLLALILEIPNSLLHIRPNVAIVGIVSILVLLLPPINNYDRFVPRIFIVVLLGILINAQSNPLSNFFQNQSLEIPGSLYGIFIFPDFSMIQVSTSILYALAIALVGILESRVNIKSIEALDRNRAKANANYEIIILGLGNVLCGFLGGLPMVVTMENSLANVNHQAKTKWSGIFQSFYILIFVLLGLKLLSYVPMISLTAIIIYITYKFNSPRLFHSISEIGLDQILIFLLTISITLLFGILPGLLGGVLATLTMYLILGSSPKDIFTPLITVSRKGTLKTKINIHGAALASNYETIQKHLHKALDTERIIVDLSQTKVVDHSFLELIYNFARYNHLDDGKMEVQGLKKHTPISRHPLSTLRIHKKNITITNDEELDERQIDLRAIAAVNNTNLKIDLTYDGVVFQDFSFTRGYEVRYRENQFMKFYKSSCLEFSDIFLSKGIRISEQSFKMSVLLVTVLEAPIPDFTLTTEDFMHKILQSVGYEDIDFDEFPAFSEKYLLNGEDKVKIRDFFNPKLINFLEEKDNLDISIETKSNQIAVYQGKSLMSKTDLEDIIEFIEGILDIIHQEEEELKIEVD